MRRINRNHILKHYRLNEAMDDSFSLEELSQLPTFVSRLNYCKQHLGNPIGNGSSRTVFQIDDGKCLKLAKNAKGIAQNEVEYDRHVESYDVTPSLFEQDDDNKWIITEYVLPAKAQDIKECLGIDFKTFCDFVKCCYNCYAYNGYKRPTEMSEEEFVELLDSNQWFNDLYYYMADYQLPCGDLLRLSNLGMVMRYGEPQIVILDSGLNNDVYNKYYKR
jgi:hypothetical protein